MSWEMGIGNYLFWNILPGREKSTVLLGRGAKRLILGTMVLVLVLFILIEKDIQRSKKASAKSLSFPDPGELSLPNSSPKVPLVYYQVQSGDTLPRIAKKFYGEAKLWRKIWQANQEVLSSPAHLQVGMRLCIPPRTDFSSTLEKKAIPRQAER